MIMPSFYEIFGNIFMLLSVFLAARNTVLTWPTGIIGCILYAFMFFDVNLYAEVTLQAFFIVTSISGWILWQKRHEEPELPVTSINLKHIFIFYITASLLLALTYGGILHSFTDASLPFIDSLVLALSIAAQFLLMRRKLQSWYFWIAVDILSISLYAYKGLYLTSLVYLLFLFNAFYGLHNWRKLEQKT